MTRGPLMWPLVRFILPVIGGSLFQQLYNTVDFVFVGNFMDKTAAAAVGASATLTYITVGMFLGISAGCNVVAAQAIGEKDHRRAEEVLHTSVSFGVTFGFSIGWPKKFEVSLIRLSNCSVGLGNADSQCLFFRKNSNSPFFLELSMLNTMIETLFANAISISVTTIWDILECLE